MNNAMIIGSFYTKNTPYEAIFNQFLKPSCDKFSLPVVNIAIDSLGDWHRNVAEKPGCIIQLLKTFVSEYSSLVFLDADSSIEKYPSLFEEIPNEYDIGFHTLNWNIWYGYKTNPPKTEVLSGTIFLRNRPKVLELCQEWYETAKTTKVWEQQVLQQILPKYDLKIYPLPIEYCFMKTRPHNKPPLVQTEPVILHHQLSRELKRKKL
jgi:hypothetical protein